jgi:luciferase family oxidoreductase group 1
VITQLLRGSGTTSDVEQFPRHVQDIAALLSGDGATVRFTSGGEYTVRATPAATGSPEVWLLGSSDYSAQLAASQGLPYVFANHFSGQGLERALDLYRTGYRPSEEHPEPRTFLTVNAVAAPTTEEAEARALPQLRMMARLRLNQPLRALETVEQAAAAASDPATDQVVQDARSRWFVGTGESVAAEVRSFAERHGVDEVMLSPVAGALDAEPKDSATGRAQTLELIAAAL